MKKIFYLFILISFLSCHKQEITRKDLMNAWTIGWNKGYQQGVGDGMRSVKGRFNQEMSRSRFIQDSCFMELRLIRMSIK